MMMTRPGARAGAFYSPELEGVLAADLKTHLDVHSAISLYITGG